MLWNLWTVYCSTRKKYRNLEIIQEKKDPALKENTQHNLNVLFSFSFNKLVLVEDHFQSPCPGGELCLGIFWVVQVQCKVPGAKPHRQRMQPASQMLGVRSQSWN